LYALLNVKEPEKKCVTVEHISLEMLKTVLLNRSVVLLVVPWLVVFIVIGSALAFGPSEGSTEALNLTWKRAALGIVVIGAVLISTQLFFGRLSDRVGRMPVLAIGTLGIAGLIVSIAVLFFSTGGLGLHGAGAERYVVYTVIGLSLILALAFGPSSLASLADVADVKTRGMTMGLYSVVITIGLSTGSIVVGFISEHAGPGAVVLFFLISAAVMVGCVILRFVDVRYWSQNKGAPETGMNGVLGKGTDAHDECEDHK
jgi:MFS family permease